MSIILKALERAQATPNQNPVLATHSEIVEPQTAHSRWIAMVLAFVAAAALAALWVTQGTREATRLEVSKRSASIESSLPRPAMEPPKAPTPRAVTTSSLPPNQVSAAPVAAVVASARRASATASMPQKPVSSVVATVTRTALSALPSANAATSTQALAGATAARTAAAVLPNTPSSATDPILALTQLPPSARAALPALTLSGIIYSEAAAQRMAIVNGEVAQEGANLAAGVELLRIEPTAIVVRSQGQRVRIGAP